MIHCQHQDPRCYISQSIILQKKKKKKKARILYKRGVNSEKFTYRICCGLTFFVSSPQSLLYIVLIYCQKINMIMMKELYHHFILLALGWNLTNTCKDFLALANIFLKCEYYSTQKPVWKHSPNLAKFRHGFYSQGLSLIRARNLSEERGHKINSK